MLQRRAVALLQNVLANLDCVPWRDADHECVERAVMNGAHCDPVWHHGLSTLCVLFDMCSVEKFSVP